VAAQDRARWGGSAGVDVLDLLGLMSLADRGSARRLRLQPFNRLDGVSGRRREESSAPPKGDDQHLAKPCREKSEFG
jgi:hypothetical protein